MARPVGGARPPPSEVCDWSPTSLVTSVSNLFVGDLDPVAGDLDPVAGDHDLVVVDVDVVVDLEHKEVLLRQDEQPLVGGPEAQHRGGGVQGGHLLLGHAAHRPALLAVEERGGAGRRLAVDVGAAHALPQRRVGEVGRARGKLLVPLGRLDVT